RPRLQLREKTPYRPAVDGAGIRHVGRRCNCSAQWVAAACRLCGRMGGPTDRSGPGYERSVAGAYGAANMRDQNAVRRQLARIAWLLDNSIPLPGTNFRIGLDAILGLVPGLGDL